MKRILVLPILLLASAFSLLAAEQPKNFATPEEAVAALSTALAATNDAALVSVFGPELDQIKNPDPERAATELAAFHSALLETNYTLHHTEGRCVLIVGTNHWPFPVPLVKADGRWHFDTKAGREELLNRQVGTNELFTLQVMREFVEAQREYAAISHDGNPVLAYAQKILSTPGSQDGLYWPSEEPAPRSPLGPELAAAEFNPGSTNVAEPFRGYFFRILTRQGSHAAGDKYDYVINGNMISGFALLAWPAHHGESGVMSFIVNQQGHVYQKDLGKETETLAPKIKEYDPDPTWHLSPD
jgi:hypothetical protein